MTRWFPHGLYARVMLAIVAVITLVVAGATAVTIRDSQMQLRDDLVESTRSQAKVLGFASSVYLARPGSVSTYQLNALARAAIEAGDVLYIAFYVGDGVLTATAATNAPEAALASFDELEAESRSRADQIVRWSGGNLEVAEPLFQAERRVGTLLLRVGTAGLEQTLARSVVLSIATAVVLLLVLAVVIAVLLRWLAIEPLRRLNEATRRVSAGDLSVQAPATSRDELGDLARAFNAMTTKLRQVLESLEQRVAERTAELSRVNETLESEIAVRKEFEEELARQATTDPLTGAHNRLKFNSELTDEIHRAQRYGEPLSLAMIDVDHFKSINDTHGHQAGDLVLVRLTQLISANLRETDKLARWGGEEFMILLPNTPLDAAARLAEKLRLVVAQADIGAVRGITCSFAVTQFRPGETIETLTARLDEALYRAKHDGRNRVAQAA